MWEHINREYLEEQTAKEAVVAASKKIFEVNFQNCSEDYLAARELTASATVVVAKSRKVAHWLIYHTGHLVWLSQ
ncbi:hypothetical protein SESBI_37728 [Sesbania bispinosa]|nr:hypothetical protein SESBI_37728 [Sesbania bispinosa]